MLSSYSLLHTMWVEWHSEMVYFSQSMGTGALATALPNPPHLGLISFIFSLLFDLFTLPVFRSWSPSFASSAQLFGLVFSSRFFAAQSLVTPPTSAIFQSSSSASAATDGCHLQPKKKEGNTILFKHKLASEIFHLEFEYRY